MKTENILRVKSIADIDFSKYHLHGLADLQPDYVKYSPVKKSLFSQAESIVFGSEDESQKENQDNQNINKSHINSPTKIE